MEKYKGIKFSFSVLNDSYNVPVELCELNSIACSLSALGVTPLHETGAYGNFSLRTKNGFIISKSQYTPIHPLNTNDYCEVLFEKKNTSYVTNGICKPSSETPLHYGIYNFDHTKKVIVHGHYPPFENETISDITEKFCDYGTPELVDSALKVTKKENGMMYLKNHGFVAYADTIEHVKEIIEAALVQTGINQKL